MMLDSEILTIYNIFENTSNLITRILIVDDCNVIFELNHKNVVVMYHEVNCCEDVHIKSYNNLECLINEPIMHVEEIVSGTKNTYTDYIFQTQKGTAIIKWIGKSNGNYDQGVQIVYSQECFDDIVLYGNNKWKKNGERWELDVEGWVYFENPKLVLIS